MLARSDAFETGGFQYGPKTRKRPLGGIIGRGQHLGDVDRSPPLVDEHEIGERAPDVYP